MSGTIVSRIDLQPGLSNHLDEHLPSLLRRSYFVKEVDAGAFHSFRCLGSQKEAQPVDRRHCRLRCFQVSMETRQENHGVDVIGIHVSEDVRRRRRKGIGSSGFVLMRVDPSHDASRYDDRSSTACRELVDRSLNGPGVDRGTISYRPEVSDRGFRRSFCAG